VYGVEAGRVQRLQRLLGKAGLRVDVRGMRGDLFFRQRADRRPQLVVLLRELEQIERRISSHPSLLSYSPVTLP
jgi:hypothetical protein